VTRNALHAARARRHGSAAARARSHVASSTHTQPTHSVRAHLRPDGASSVSLTARMRSLAALSQPSFPAGVPGLVSTRACGCARPSALSCDEFATSVTEVCSARRTLARNRPQQAARAAQGTPAAPGAHRAVGTRRRRVRRALPSNQGQGGCRAGRLRAAAAWRPVRASWRRQQLCAVRAGRRLRLRRLVHCGSLNSQCRKRRQRDAARARRSVRRAHC
jgi:hypothetical protein